MLIDSKELARNMVQECDPFENVKERNEEYEGYMGNSGPTAIHWYRTSVAVLVPRGSRDMFLTKSLDPTGAQNTLDQYLPKTKDAETMQAAYKIVRSLATTAWGPEIEINTCSYRSRYLPKCTPDPAKVSDVLLTALLFHDYELFNNIVAWIREQGCITRTLESVNTAMTKSRIDVDQIKHSLLDTITKRPLHDWADAVDTLRLGTQPSMAIEAFVAEIVDQAIKKLEDGLKNGVLPEEDGMAIMSMVDRREDYDIFKTRLLPIIESSTSITGFACNAVEELVDRASKGVYPTPEGLDLAQRLIESIITAMDITQLRTQNALVAELPRTYYAPKALNPAQLTRTIHHERLHNLIQNCVAHSWDTLLDSFTQKITAQAPSIPVVEFHALWLPLLSALLKTVPTETDTETIELHQTHYKPLFLAILNSYLTRYVGAEPPREEAPNFSLPAVYCHSACGDCTSLNAFLASPTQQVGRFQVDKERRKHLHRVLEARFGGGWSGQALPPGGEVVRHETDRGTCPETLVVTKVGSRTLRVRAAWEVRAQGAGAVLDGLVEDGDLRGVLGEEHYARIVGMGFLMVDGVARERVAGDVGAGVKRSAEEAGMGGSERAEKKVVVPLLSLP
ncbi:hypothetical protein C8A00DRAFT_36857 [Chaetomidium leptoderma]|uniref:Uncharacterized protein n=1 Tax=Chaetomidium leptoderma TaxID=669021 RepID=A0AAN6VFM4_9PEZI|nr:hypothetical protein C8A00DRAFT_36857 [Chaetomidium leptoderma]